MDEAALFELAEANPMQAALVAGDLQKMSAPFANPTTRANAEAVVVGWTQHGAPLRKAFAAAWLERARANVGGAKRVKAIAGMELKLARLKARRTGGAEPPLIGQGARR